MKDESLGKLQSEINAELYERLSSGSTGILLSWKGSVDNYSDLPGDAKPGDTWNVRNPVETGDEEYPAGTNFSWTGDHWDSLGGVVGGDFDEINRRLDTIEGESDGSIKKSLEEAKSYTDEKLNDSITWVDIIPE